MGKGLVQTLCKRGYPNFQETYEKVFNFNSDQENANYDHTAILLYSDQNGQNEKDKQ